MLYSYLNLSLNLYRCLIKAITFILYPINRLFKNVLYYLKVILLILNVLYYLKVTLLILKVI